MFHFLIIFRYYKTMPVETIMQFTNMFLVTFPKHNTKHFEPVAAYRGNK